MAPPAAPAAPARSPRAATTASANGSETDVDCGGPTRPKCAEGKSCLADSDCERRVQLRARSASARRAASRTSAATPAARARSARPARSTRAAAARSPVPGYTDPRIPARRSTSTSTRSRRAACARSSTRWRAQNGGNPDVKGWIAAAPPADLGPGVGRRSSRPTTTAGRRPSRRRLLGDPRPRTAIEAAGPGRDPAARRPIRPSTWARTTSSARRSTSTSTATTAATYPGSYGFPTYYYPADVLEPRRPARRAPTA